LDLSLIGAPIVLGVLLVMLARDIRLIRRREPIKYWFSNTIIYADDPLYWLAVFQRVIPYGVPIGLVLIIGIILAWGMF